MMRREDYKAVKHMDREQMNTYLERVYKRAYRAGYTDALKSGAKLAVSHQESNGEQE